MTESCLERVKHFKRLTVQVTIEDIHRKTTKFLGLVLKQFAKGFAAEKQMIAAAAAGEGPTRERRPPHRSSDRRSPQKLYYPRAGAGAPHGRCPPRGRRRMGRRSNAKPAGARLLHNLGSPLRRTPQLSVVRRVLSDRRESAVVQLWGPQFDENLTRRINRLSLFSNFLAFSEERSVSFSRGVTQQDGFVMEAPCVA